ncbi:MAG: 3'-5' exonuclease [Parvularculaceae bacterium]|nr:3'-5' exonuclease [Parvularculaceae bacterium]
MRLILSIVALALVAVAARAAENPQYRFPKDGRERMGLAHVDIETTGLDPRFHEMIDIGMIYTDLDGAEIDRLYVRILPPHPERLDPGAKAVNGFDEAYWRKQGAVDEGEAVRRILAFHARASAGRQMIFTAYNVWFDQSFLDALLRRHGAAWRDLFHYHVLDIPSIAWGQGIKALNGTDVAAALGIPDETRVPIEHTGLTGAAFNVSVYRALIVKRAAATP